MEIELETHNICYLNRVTVASRVYKFTPVNMKHVLFDFRCRRMARIPRIKTFPFKSNSCNSESSIFVINKSHVCSALDRKYNAKGFTSAFRTYGCGRNEMFELQFWLAYYSCNMFTYENHIRHHYSSCVCLVLNFDRNGD